MAISSPGVGSNLDVNSIVTQLMAVESQPLTRLTQKEASYQAKLSAFGSLSGALGAFQNALSGLSNAAKFQSVNATPADAGIITASATSQAVAGSYNVNVTKIAQAHTIATTGQASTSATIGSGASTTLTFQFGTISGGTLTDGIYSGATFAQDANQSTGTVTIDSSNNSLQGIRDAINKAGLGVTATIVADGSATPNHLVLTTNKTGVTSSMKISVDGDPALQGLLGYNPEVATDQKLTQSAAAQSTALTVNGIAISSATKTVSEAIQGVTLNVTKEGSTTLTLARDTAAVQNSVSTLVKAYNDINNTINTLTSYDATTGKGGILLGDSTARSIQADIRKVLTTPVQGSSGSLTTLSQIGVAFQKDGTLALDSSKLQKAINENFNDIAGLFATVGTTTDSLISFAGSTSASRPGNPAINITRMATQGTVTGSVAAGLNITTENNRLAITVDGIDAAVTLEPGTYTATSLAAQVQSAVNGASALSAKGIAVNAAIDNSGILSITSKRFGSASNVKLSGTAASYLLGASPISTTGVDVAGTLDGVEGAGSGQVLTGKTGTSTEGIKLQVLGGALGSRGTINLSQGYAVSLSQTIDNYIGNKGLITSRTDGINSSIKDIGRQQDAMNLRLATIEKQYRAQFTALDTAIGSMKNTSSYLTQQLDLISTQSKN